MNLKAVIKYGLYDTKKPLVIFYGIIYGLLIFLSLAFRKNGNVFVMSLEFASLIFIFVAGLNSFKKCFEFYQANGISRKAQHLGFIINVWIVAAGMALIDNINSFIFSKVITYHSAFYQFYGNANSAVTKGAFDIFYFLQSFLWAMFAYAMFFTIGYSISLLYYKMNRTWKIIVSIGVPALYYSFSMVDYWINDAKISYWLIDSVGITLGVAQNSHNPHLSVITTGLVTLILTIINHAMIRKTALK